MVQVLKDTIRAQIIAAATAQFAEVGFLKATMGTIANTAGVATGTIYKYFESKKALFEAIITDAFVDEYFKLTRSRIASFVNVDDMSTISARKTSESGKLVRFYIENRFEIIIILSCAAGTKYESFPRDYIKDMESQTISQAREYIPRIEMSETFRFMVTNILEESVRFLVAALRKFDEPRSISSALSAITTYQMAGIQALVAWACPEEK